MFKKIISTCLALCTLTATCLTTNAQTLNTQTANVSEIISRMTPTKIETIQVTNDNLNEFLDEYNIEIPEAVLYSDDTTVDFNSEWTVSYYEIPGEVAALYGLPSTKSVEARVLTSGQIISSTDWKDINGSKYGMSHWLDLAFDYLIGKTTKYIYVPATLLGISASDFLPEYKEGEVLKERHTKITEYQYGQVKPSNTWTTLITTEGIEFKQYVDITAYKKTGGIYEKLGTVDTEFFTAKYFDKPSQLVDRTLSLYAKEGVLVKEVYNIP